MFSYRLPIDAPVEIQAALDVIAEDFPIRANGDSPSLTIIPSLSGRQPSFKYADGTAWVSGATIPQMLRSLASLRGFAESGAIPNEYTEDPHFDMLGLMIDTSRNAVLTVSGVKYVLRRMALMGMNTLMLYTEDTYEVPGQPLIGYMRGRYTQSELTELDQYASILGIEMFPCIQTLGHLSRMLRWDEFTDVKDTPDILLVEDKKTYDLLEQMLRSASAPYKSRRIHIGMDEAHGIGLGRYMQLKGVKPRFDLMNAHLSKVMQITRSLGLEPMIWSDMYFRLGSACSDYYDRNAEIPKRIAEEIPKDLKLVYWDYYHPDKEFYLEWIDRHRALGFEPIFAGGLWTSHCFWANTYRTFVDNDAAMAACKENGVREVFTTAWGDDGASSDILSMLPGLQHFADHGYSASVTMESLARQFRGACGSNINHWLLGSELDGTPGSEKMDEWLERLGWGSEEFRCEVSNNQNCKYPLSNPSHYLLWQDPLLGLFDGYVRGLGLSEHYKELAHKLRKAVHQSGNAKEHIQFALRLAEILQDKAELGVKLYDAYNGSDITTLRLLHSQTLPRILRATMRLHEQHRKLWFSLNKPNGWEIMDRRYSALIGRLRSAILRVGDYLDGSIEHIKELEEPRLCCFPGNAGRLPDIGITHDEVVSPTC